MYCKNCGTKIKTEAQFCENCGAKIDENIVVIKKSNKKPILILSVICSILTVVVIIFSLANCNGCAKEKAECFLCEEVKRCEEKTFWGEPVYVCDDCMDMFENDLVFDW